MAEEITEIDTGFAEEPSFYSLSDPGVTTYIENKVYDELISTLDSDDYFVENISAVYVSQEYLEEFAYNSQTNIYFGYTLAELDAKVERLRAKEEAKINKAKLEAEKKVNEAIAEKVATKKAEAKAAAEAAAAEAAAAEEAPAEATEAPAEEAVPAEA